MRHAGLRALTGAVILVLAASAQAAVPVTSHKVIVVEPGRTFCPSTTLVHGDIAIQPGRCFWLAILRDAQGTFLVFAEPGMAIPPGQTVRLDTPEGEILRGRIVYRVPIAATAVVPDDAIGLARIRIDDFGPRIRLTIVNPAPSPNLVLTFYKV